MKKLKATCVRIFMCLMITIPILTGTVAPVSAAGTETWGSNTGPWEKIRVYNDNWTPVKTMGRNGNLVIDHFISPCKESYCGCSDNEPENYPPLYVNIKIVDYDSGEILANEWYQEHTIFSYDITTDRPVYVGERVRIYFDICSLNNPPGAYRKSHIQFRYRFT